MLSRKLIQSGPCDVAVSRDVCRVCDAFACDGRGCLVLDACLAPCHIPGHNHLTWYLSLENASVATTCACQKSHGDTRRLLALAWACRGGMS